MSKKAYVTQAIWIRQSTKDRLYKHLSYTKKPDELLNELLDEHEEKSKDESTIHKN